MDLKFLYWNGSIIIERQSKLNLIIEALAFIKGSVGWLRSANASCDCFRTFWFTFKFA